MFLMGTQIIGIEALAGAGPCRLRMVVLLKRHVVAGRVVVGHFELKVARRYEDLAKCDTIVETKRGELHQL